MWDKYGNIFIYHLMKGNIPNLMDSPIKNKKEIVLFLKPIKIIEVPNTWAKKRKKKHWIILYQNVIRIWLSYYGILVDLLDKNEG